MRAACSTASTAPTRPAAYPAPASGCPSSATSPNPTGDAPSSRPPREVAHGWGSPWTPPASYPPPSPSRPGPHHRQGPWETPEPTGGAVSVLSPPSDAVRVTAARSPWRRALVRAALAVAAVLVTTA